MNMLYRLTRWVPPVDPELSTLPEHLSSSSVLNGVRVAQSLVFYVVFCRSYLFFYFGYCIVCPWLRFMASDYLFGIFKLFLTKLV